MPWKLPTIGPVWFLSDLHGGSPLTYVPPELPPGVHLVAIGDLLEGFTPLPMVDDIWSDLCDRHPGRIHLIRGNHDCDYLSHGWWTSERDITGRVLNLGNLWVAGIGWTGSKPFQSPRPQDLEPLLKGLDTALASRPPEVSLALATHYVPNLNPWRRRDPLFAEAFPYVGHEDDALLPWVQRWKPQAVVCGHLHEFSGANATTEGLHIISSVVPAMAPMNRRGR